MCIYDPSWLSMSKNQPVGLCLPVLAGHSWRYQYWRGAVRCSSHAPLTGRDGWGSSHNWEWVSNWKQPFSCTEKCSFLLAKTVCRLLTSLTPTSDQRCSNGKKEFHHWHSVYNTLSKPCSLILESKAGIQFIVEQGTWWVRTLNENRLFCFGFFSEVPIH